ncbi:hypothetical protein ABH922_004698 [Rhodococcus sp. 27YEA15]
MAPSAGVIRCAGEAYVKTGSAAQVVELYAEAVSVEDPAGTEVRTTWEAIGEFYAVIENFDQTVVSSHARDRRKRSRVSFLADCQSG